MFNFQRDILKNAVTGSVDKDGKVKIDTPLDIIRSLNEVCDFKSDNIQFIITEPKPHPNYEERDKLVCIMDFGGAAIIHADSERKEVLDAILKTLDDMKESMNNAKKAIKTIKENPF
jgi:hypothetical protein